MGGVLRFAPMLDKVPQRERWHTPENLGDAWVLRNGENVARCFLVRHPLGWELRLITNDLLRSQVCRTTEEILQTHEQWKAAMVERGWR